MLPKCHSEEEGEEGRQGRDIKVVSGSAAAPDLLLASTSHSPSLKTTSSSVVVYRASSSSPPPPSSSSSSSLTGLCSRRFRLLFIYGFICLLGGNVYWGWALGLRELLFRGGAYAWTCPVNTPRPPVASDPICVDQETLVGNLLTYAFFSHFVFSFLGGAFLDRYGPKKAGIFGQTLKLLGFFLLSASSEQFPCYIISLCLIGASVDTANFPIIMISTLFPKYKSIVVSFLGACVITSSSVPLILNKIWDLDPENFSFRKILFVYSGVCIGLSFILSVMFIPWKPFVSPQNVEEPSWRNIETLEEGKGRMQEEKHDKIAASEKGVEWTSTCYDKPIGFEQNRREEEEKKEGGKGEECVQETTDGMEDQSIFDQRLADASKMEIVVTSDVIEECKIDNEKKKDEKVESELKNFLRYFRHPSYWLVVPYFSFALLRNLFFTLSAKEQLGSTYFVWGILGPLRIFPIIIFGTFAHFMGVYWMIFALNLTGFALYIFVMINTLVCKYIAICFGYFFTAYNLTCLYTYVGVTQPKRHFGKCVGFASFCAGMTQLVAIPMFSYSKHQMNNNFLLMDGLMLALGGLSFILVGLMYWLNFREKKNMTMMLK